MMRHSTVRTLLACRPDLSPREQQRLERHLSDCSECRTIGQEYRRQQTVLRQYPLRPAPVSPTSMSPVRSERHIWDALDQFDRSMRAEPARASGWRMYTKLYTALAVAIAAVIVAATSVSMAGSRQASLTDLGPPTNALPQFPPMTGGFHRVKTTLTSHGLPELLFIGTLVDDGSTAERWPVVKALNQFGRLSNVSPVVSRGCLYQLVALVPRLQCVPTEEHGFITGLATFDWSHAVYHSRYLAFVHKDLIDQNLQMRAKLSPLERSLFIKYVALPGFNGYHDTVWHTAVDQHSVEGMLHLSHRFPLLVVGRSVETGNNVAISGDLNSSTGRTVLPFAAVQQSLMSGHAQGGAPATLVPDYNVETNVITALICTADGLQPRAVCGRPVIRTILTALKRGPAYLTAALIKLRSQRGAL